MPKYEASDHLSLGGDLHCKPARPLRGDSNTPSSTRTVKRYHYTSPKYNKDDIILNTTRMRIKCSSVCVTYYVCKHTLLLINPRRACAARVTVVGSVCVSVCLSVCMSVTQHLTSRTFIRPTNDMTYLTGDEGQNFVGFSLKMLRCRVRAVAV